MKKILLIVMFITSLVFADATFGEPKASEKPLFAQGKIKLQLTQEAQYSGKLSIDNSSKAYSITGFESMDQLNMKNSTTNFRKAHKGAKNKELEKKLGLDRWYLIDIPQESDVLSVIEEYKNDPNVEFANPEYFLYTQAIPNDPFHVSHHWGHNNTGQMLQWTTGDTYNHTGNPVGTVGFDANAHSGWDGSQGYGSSTVIIAILDSGVDTGHEDINDVTGYDFGDDDNNPMDDSADPGHGTSCAGVAAGIADNGKGVAGVAGGSRIMPIKLSDSAGSMYVTALDGGLMWAADQGADILSMSFGIVGASPGDLPSTTAALEYAYNSGCVLLAATDNENNSSISYPANHADVLAVGASAPDGGRKDPNSIDGEYWWGSSYGSTTQDGADAVDFLAPTILPTTDISGNGGYQNGDYYLYFNGTSCATPYAAGFAALIKSKYPSYTNAQIGSLMKSTCIDVENAGWDRYAGYGEIDIQAALNAGGTPPGVPTLVSPSNGSSLADLTPTFDWDDVVDADSYTILVDNASNFSSPEINQTVTSSTFTSGSDLAEGIYYWKVLATNASGSSAYSTIWDVTLTAPLPLPGVPTLITPTDGSTVEDLTPTFDWSDASDATGYNIKICTNKQMTTVYIETSTTASEFTPPSDMHEDTYFWWVSSTNATGESATTGYWDVNVIAPPPPPGAPTLIAPSNGSGTTDTTPSFDWSDVADALDYEILVDNNSDFSSPEINQTGLAVSDFTATVALSNGTYYWKVRGTNASGPGTYSVSWNFAIGAAPGIPVLVAPANASLTVDQTPAFDWNNVTDAVSYTILVDNDINFGSPEIDQTVAVSTYTPGTDLGLGVFYWKVLATNTYGSSAYSGSWSIDIGAAPATPVLVSPSNGSTTADYRPIFDWNNVTGADSYNILVDNDVNFGSPEIDQNTAVSTYLTPSDLAIGTYYWKVSATNSYGTGSYSGVWDFTTPVPDINLSTVSISNTVAPDQNVSDSFDIGNTGGIDLDYTISYDYVTAGGTVDLLDNTFDTDLGWTESGVIIWNWSNSGNNLDGSPFAELVGTSDTAEGVLTSAVFDGSMCESMTVEFDQNCIFSNPSSGSVEYTIDGSNWIQVYTNTASLGDWGTPDHQSVNIPTFSSTMQVRFVGYLKKNSGSSWNIDNIDINGYSSGPSYTWLTIDSPVNGSVLASGSNTINITCDATGLTDGTYNAEITVDSNDPDEGSEIIAVEFIVFQSTVIPEVPANVITNIVGSDLVIDWDVSADATGYDVYSSDDPYGTFTLAASVGTNQYTVPADQAKLFYYIIATNSTK